MYKYLTTFFNYIQNQGINKAYKINCLVIEVYNKNKKNLILM